MAVRPIWRPPPARMNLNGFRQDSTVCKACTRHLFRTEAIQCRGKCRGEYHDGCAILLDWKCDECKEDNATREDFNKLMSAVGEISKNLANTNAKLAKLQKESEASKISDNVKIMGLNTQLEDMRVRFDGLEEQMNSMKEEILSTTKEIKTTVVSLEKKIVGLTAEQTKLNKIDIRGVQDTLTNASQIIINEMCKTLDRLLEEKLQLQPPNNSQKKGKIVAKRRELNEKMVRESEQVSKTVEDERKSLGKTPHQQPKTRLQQLAEQFQLL